MGGVLTITGVQITFAGITASGGVATGGTVTITATSAKLSNLGTGVTSTIGSITGNYNISTKAFSLTLNNISLAFSSFETITATSANLTYNGSATTPVTVTDGTTTSTKSVSLVTIGINNATVFAGINGPDTNPNAIGVKVTGANLALALMSDTSGVTYYGIRATAGLMTAVGLPTGFTLASTDLEVNVNGTSSGSNVVNFDASFTSATSANGKGLDVSTGSGSVNLDYQKQFLSASGTLELDFKGFIYIHGSMAITSAPTTSVFINNGTTTSGTATIASELLIGADNVTVFAGINGPADNASAVGVQLTGASLALALFKPTTGSDTYYGLYATATSLTGVGLPTGFHASASDISVQINGSKNGTGSAVDFVTSFGSNGLAVATSSTTTKNLKFTSAILSVSGTLDLDFKGFIYIHGSMAITSVPTATVYLNDGTTTSATPTTVSELLIGANDVTVYALVNGPASNASAVGVQLTGASMALALFKPTTGSDTYYGLKATATSLSGVGLPTGFTASATDISVQINGDKNNSGSTVDFITSFGATGLAVATSSSTSVDLDFTSAIVSVSGTLELDINGFIYIHGSMAITSVPTATVYLNDGTTTSTTPTTVSELLIGANDVTIFVGINGPASNASAMGVQLTGASLALAIFKPATGSAVYYGLQATATSLAGVGLPTGFSASATNISVQINGSKNDGSNVVDFDTSFTSATSSNGKGLDVATSSSTHVNLDFASAIISVAGTLELDFNGFVYIHGSMAITSVPTTTVYLTDGTTTDTTATTVSELLIGADDVTVFVGVNGPSTSATATGVELAHAGFALALFKSTTSSAAYYGLETTAGSISAVGLPSNFTIAANDLKVQINGSNNAGGKVVNFDASFTSTTATNGKGLDVPTSDSTSVNLDFNDTLVMVAATITLDLGDSLHISGSFSFSKNSTEVDIEVGVTAFDGATALTFKLGSATNPYVTATGNLSMVINANSIIINHADLTVPGTFTIGSLLSVTTPGVSIDHFVIDRVTGNLSGDGTNNPSIEITASSATLFPGNTTITASVSPTNPGGTGLDAKFDLVTGAFSISVQKFQLVVGTVLTANASDVLITYDPEDSDPHQQLVQIGAGTITFNQFNITGSLTNLKVYKDGFHFDSVTIAYTGTVTMGSILSLKDPSVTLTDFGVTFGGSNTTITANGTLTLAVASATLNVGSSFTATATTLSITVALDPDHLGDTTITAGTVTLVFGTAVSISATNISINTAPVDGGAYLSVGSATATLNVGTALSATGTATNFSLIKSGSSVQLHEDTGFSLTITVTPGQLHLPTWLGFQITKFEVQWTDFANHPEQFILILSANINSISGLPGGVTVSGEITDAVIDIGKLEAGQFPITSIGSVGGSVSGTLFGLEVNASFVLGIVKFNAENQIINADGTVTTLTTNPNGSVTETIVTVNPDTVVKDSVMYVGVSGGAMIPGVGGVQIYIGFSSLGPLTVYLSAEVPLIIEPNSGLAIGGFSGGVIFNYTIPTPGKAADLAGIHLSPAGITISEWQMQLRDQTVSQYTASSGGTNLAAAYSQPFVIEAGITLYDAYLSREAFTITGNIAIQIDPAHASNVKIFVTGTATFGASVSFNAFLYANIDASNPTPTVTVMFLVQAPADIPVESYGGSLTIGFTDAAGNPLTPTAPTTTTTTQTITLPDGTTHDYTQTTFTPATQTIGGFYISIDGFASFSAFGTLTATISGSVTLTVTGTFAKIDLSGTLNISLLGDLATASGSLVVDYSGGLTDLKIYGALKLQPGAGLAKLQEVGLYVDGAITFVINTTDSVQTVYLPDPVHPHVIADATAFDITTTQAFEVTIGGITAGTYASLQYKVDGHTILNMQGDFDLKIDASGLTMFADIHALTVGPSGSPFLTLSGFGLFVINDQGFAAEMDLSLSAQNITGITLDASFTLVLNTTSADVTYTIPSTLPVLTIPGTSPAVTVTTLTIPRGPPQGLLQSDGTFASYGATGPYIVITGQGHLHLYSFDLSGFFYFQMSNSASGTVVSLVVSVSGDLGFGTVDITGGFQISSAGVVALLEASGSAGTTTNYGTGISLQVTAELAFNSTGSDVTSIGGIALKDTDGNPLTITAHSASVVASGTMTLTFGGASLVITGVFSTSVVDTGSGGTLVHTTTITAGGTLKATIGGSTLLTLNVSGVMVFKSGAGAGTSAGMAGQLTATIGGVNPLSGNGFSFNGTFDLQVNTTGVTQTVAVGAGTVTISAGPNGSTTGSAYAEVHAHGNLIFGTASNGFLLNNADFYLVAGTAGLAVSASATMVIEVGGTSLLSVSASGAMFISSAGFAASLTVTTSFNDPSGNSYYAFNGTFVLQVNTTGATQTIGSVTIPAAANGSTATTGGGAYFQMHITGNLSLGTTNTNLASATGMVMHGEFYLTVSSAGLAISASTTLYLVVAGSDLFTFTANGALLITSSGIAAKISLTIGSGASGTGFTFGASMAYSLALNTTGSAVSVINNQTVNLPAGPYFQVKVSGNLTLAGVVTVQGSFTLTVNSTSVVINFNASLNLFGNVFTITGDAGIYSNGIAINLTLALGTNTSPTVYLIPGVIAVSGTFNLQINTTGTAHFGVAANVVFQVTVSNLNIFVFGFKMGSASFMITVNSSGVFSSSGTLTFDFFGFITLNITYNFDSTGQYYFHGSIYVQVGSDGFNIHGTLHLTFSNEPGQPSFELYVQGGVTAFGIVDIISASVTVTISGTSVDMSVYAGISIDLGFYTIHIGGTVHIHLGSLNVVTPPPPPVISTVSTGSITVGGRTFGAGTLLLNIGDYATSNGRGVPPSSDENYTISVKQVNGDGSVNLLVSAPGVYGQAIEYDNVRQIVVPEADASNVTVNIDGAVTLPVTIFAGSGVNQFFLGGGTGTVIGTNGNDTVFGGTGNVTFTAGSGASTFKGGGTGSTHNVINDPGTVTVVENGYSSYSLIGTSATSATLTYGGNTDVLNGVDIAVALTGAASGHQTFTVANYFGAGVTLDSASNTDVATTITLDTGNLTVDGNIITASNGTNGTVTLQGINSATLNGGSAANALTVNSWSGTGTLTLDGKGGDDTYNINFQSSGSFTATVSDSGGSGTDSLITNGTTGNDTIKITGSAVTLGTQTVNYSGVESLTVYTKTGNDTVNLAGASIATNINTGGGTNTINLGSHAFTTNTTGTLNNFTALVTVTGGGTDTVNLDDTGDTGANTGTLSGTTLDGVFGSGGSLNYSSIENFNLNLGSGGNTLTITDGVGTTNINSGSGNDTVNIQGMNGTMVVNTGAGTNTVNIGSTMPTVGGVLTNIKGALTITGGGTTTLNVDDTGDVLAVSGTLTGSTLKGLGMGASGITYSGVTTLVISLGSGGNTFTITTTGAATILNSGSAADTINLTTDANATTINGQGGNDIINVTNTGATTTINGGNGNDTVNIFNNGATLNIFGQGENDTINIRATGATTNVDTGSGTNTINIGSLAPNANGILDNIQGAVIVTGNGNDTLNADDTGSSTGKTGALTSGAVTGFGMIAAGITYSGLAALNISLGSGGDTVNVRSTNSTTVSTIKTGLGTNAVNITSNAPTAGGGVLTGIAGLLIVNGQGTDTVNVNDTGDASAGTLTQTATTLTGLGMGADGIEYHSIETLNVRLASHNNTIYLQGNASVTTENLFTGSGTNTINIGTNAGTIGALDSVTGNAPNTGSVLDYVQGIINITGSGTDVMNVDDSGSTTGENGGLWSNKLQFLDPVTINFTGIVAINISFGSGNDQLVIVDTITSASATPVIVIDGNAGDDTFVVFDTHAVTTLNGGDNDDNFYNFGNSAVLNLNGNAGDDTFYIYASVSETTSLDPGAADSNGNQVYSYRVNARVNIDGGTGNDKVFIFATVLNDVITINGTSVTGAGLDVSFTNIEQLIVAGLGGDDTFYILAIAVPTTIIGDGTIVLPSVAALLTALGLSLPNLDGNAPPATSFNDTFYVGWQGANYIPGRLSGIKAALTILGDNGENLDGTTTNRVGSVDTIYVDDSGDTANRNFTLTDTTLTSNAMGPLGLINYDGAVENLNIHAGAGDDTITINGNATASQTTIYGGPGNDNFIINDAPLQAPLAIVGEANTFWGDTLTLNGDAAGNDFVITGFTIDGAGATISYTTIEKLIVNADGATNFTLNGNSVPTYLNGAAEDDTFTINSSSAPLYLDGGAGADTFTINGNSGPLTATGDAGNDVFTVNGNGGSIALSGGADNDTFTINGNSGSSLVANGDAGNDTFTVNALGSPATLNGGAGDDSFTANSPLAASLTVNGGGDTNDTLTVNGTTANDYITVTGNTVDGAGSTIHYNTVSFLIVNVLGGDDTILVLSDSVNTTLNGGTGNDTFYIRTTNGATFINTGTGINTVNIGSDVPYPASSIVDGIQGAVTVTGNNRDTLNIDDTASESDKTGTLTATTLNGLGMGAGGITYTGILNLNLLLGLGSDTLNIQSTNATTKTIVNTGTGSNTINVGSLEPVLGGIVDNIQGILTLIGSGTDTLNVDDTGSTIGKTGTLTSTTLTGLGMGASGIIYSSLSVLNISLGSGGDAFLIVSTPTAVTTVNGNDGADTFNVQSNTGALNLNGGIGNDTFNFGSLMPTTGGTVNNLVGQVTVNGGGDSDTVNVDDTADTTSNTGTLTASSLTGLGMGNGINYSAVETLNISLGSGGNTFTISSTNAATTTTLNSGSAADTINLLTDSGLTYINAQGGNDTINIQSTGAVTNVNTGAGTNTVNVGSLAPAIGGIVDNIQGALTITGSGADTLNVDDTGSTGSKTGTLTATTLTGLAMGASGITYSGLAALNISLGSGGNIFNINNTYSSTVTMLNSGSGADTVNLYADAGVTNINTQAANDVINIQSTNGTTTVNTGLGTNTINVGSLAPTLTGGIVDNIQGQLIIQGSGSDTLNVDDTGSEGDKTGTLTATMLTGLAMGAAGITYSGLSVLNISLGSGDDTLLISSTSTATTTVNGNAGADTFNVQANTGALNLNGGVGNDTFNFGSLQPTTGGVVDNLVGLVTVNGGGDTDVVNVDDTGDEANNNGTLTDANLTGLGMGNGINYALVETLNINLGSGNDTFNVQATNAITVTTLNTGDGENIINVGSLAPSTGGIVDNIQGALIIVGSGSDTLNVDDTGSEGDKTGTLTSTTLTGLAMGAAGITYSGLSVLNISLGSGDDTFTINSVTPTTSMTVDAGAGTDTAILSFNSSVNIESLTLLNFEDTTLYVNGDFTGLLNDSGPISEATITGSLTSGSEIDASAIGTMTIGGDLAGLLNVSGLLDTLTVGGGTPGKIIAGDINVITVLAGYGNKVLQVIEGGIERQIQATPVGGGNLPGTIHFAFVYDSESAADPQLAIRITNTAPVARSFNLVLAVINSSTAKFNLSRVDSYLGGKTGVSNIALQGDLLISLTIPELQLFTDLTTVSLGGVVLPADSITGVEVSGKLPIGFINVAGIEGLAFSVLTTALGVPVTLLGTLGSAKNPQVLWNLLGSKAALNMATDAFVIPFNETGSVKLYAHDKLSLDLQLVMTLADQLNDNAPITAYVQINPSLTKSTNPSISNLAFVGAGASVNSLVAVANLTSTGSLGNVTVGGTAGLGNVTATSIFGSINVTSGGITGLIQTTAGDLGAVIINGVGTITGVTSIFAKGSITGQIISRGNLVSSISTSGAFSGVIAAQGDMGAIQRDGSGNAVTTAGALTRFGGISIKGNDSGKIIALGNLFGNVTISGTMTGRIAVQGQAIAGLSVTRLGILGGIAVKSFALGAAIVSGGQTGDVASKTTIALGSAKGFLAAVGGINLASTTKIAAANMFKNLAAGANLSALNAIFTDASTPLTFDTGGNLVGLGLIKVDLAGLGISGGSLTGTTP